MGIAGNDETPAENFIEPAEMPTEEAPVESPSMQTKRWQARQTGMVPGLPASSSLIPHEGVAQFEFNGTAMM